MMRIAAMLLAGVALNACSVLPDWVDPATWMGPDVSDQGQAENGQYGDLSKVPNRPAAPASSDERQQVAESLAAAGESVQYSAEALRGGTEPAAPPPAPPSTPGQIAKVEHEAATEAENQSEAAEKAAKPAESGPEASAAAEAAAEFRPSKAPPLDAAAARFVPQSVLQKYAETAPRGAVSTSVESPVAVIGFTSNSTSLDAEGRDRVRAAAQAYRARGGTGYVRVVGHASGASGSLPAAKQMQMDFDSSEARAKSVARELIQDGVAPNKVLIDAVGDSRSVGPAARTGAEIFLEG